MSAIPRRKLSVEEYLAVERLAPFKSDFYDGVMYPTAQGPGEMVVSAIPRRKLSVAEYLAIERIAPFKSDFYDGEMFAMAGAKPAHNRIKDNLIRHLGNAFDGGSCFTMSSDMRVTTPGTTYYTYPDIVIVCGKAEYEGGDPEILMNPRVIFEVLSDTTEDYDRGFKKREFQRIESLQEYVLVSQDEARIEQFVRLPDQSWEAVEVEGLSSTLSLRSVSAAIPLADIYAGVAFGS